MTTKSKLMKLDSRTLTGRVKHSNNDTSDDPGDNTFSVTSLHVAFDKSSSSTDVNIPPSRKAFDARYIRSTNRSGSIDSSIQKSDIEPITDEQQTIHYKYTKYSRSSK